MMTKYQIFLCELLAMWQCKPHHIRHGQALMNYLFTFDQKQYREISSVNYHDRTDLDCFYVDKLIPNTLEHLKQSWNGI